MRIALASLFVAGCGFNVSSPVTMNDATDEGTGRADADGDATDSAITDMPTDAPGGICGGKVWEADFSTNPTALNINGDGVNDWSLRNGSVFPIAELSGGAWHQPSAGLPQLDSRPGQPFLARTIVHGRMKGAASNGSKGAVAYINVGWQETAAGSNSWRYLVVYADAVMLGNGMQQLNLWSRNAGGSEIGLASSAQQPNNWIEFDMDIDPTARTIRFRGAGLDTTQPLELQSPISGTLPQWLSLTGYSTAADFDHMRMEVCP